MYTSGLPYYFQKEEITDTVNKCNYLPTSTLLFNDPRPDGNMPDLIIQKLSFCTLIEVWEN